MRQPWPHNVSFFVDNEVLQVPVRNTTHIADYSEMQVYSITMQLFAAVSQTNNFSICCDLRFLILGYAPQFKFFFLLWMRLRRHASELLQRKCQGHA